MTFIQALYGSGGWPLSVFLSPNLKPMMGGTYFPPDDKYNRAGFKTVLRLEQFNRLKLFLFLLLFWQEDFVNFKGKYFDSIIIFKEAFPSELG